MTIGSILLSLALLVLVGLFVVRPLLKHSGEHDIYMTKRQRLINEKEVVLAQIQDLDFDYETGKIPTEMYEQQRAHLVQQAAHLLQEIDSLAVTPLPESANLASDQEIEAAIARLRQKPAKTPAKTPAPAAAAQANHGHGRFCSQCGQQTDPEDKFCAYCGHKLAGTVQPSTAS